MPRRCSSANQRAKRCNACTRTCGLGLTWFFEACSLRERSPDGLAPALSLLFAFQGLSEASQAVQVLLDAGSRQLATMQGAGSTWNLV